MIFLPAIDLRGGRCVRLRQGDYAQETIYFDDPVAVARQFAVEGATWLHLVDLDGAKSGRPEHLQILRRIIEETGLLVEWGGGVRTIESARAVLEAGAERVVVGSALVKNPGAADAMLSTFGGKIVAGIDAKEGKIAVEGWTEESTVDAIELILALKSKGLERAVVTDIANDGMLTGPNLELLGRAVETGVMIVQSGGIASLADLLSTRGAGAEGVIVGKALYEGKFTVADAMEFLAS